MHSFRSKFYTLTSIVKENIGILMISETKLDSSFPQTQFRTEGYAISQFRNDRNSHDGDIKLFIRKDVPAKKISITPLKDFEEIFVELSLYYVDSIILIRILFQIICIFSEKYWIRK